MYLFEQLETIFNSGLIKKEVPDYVVNNLSPLIKLRDYQEKAFQYTLIYLESDLSKNKQVHLLYHMATGSGKTVIMAMNILYYYKKGFRNFLFFTNRTNIISKTKINFTKKGSSKYLFNNEIVIDGRKVQIKEVASFSESDPESINICFSTVQGIQSSLSLLHEGRMDISDFEDNDVVLIADEAHHLNSTTAKDKQENEDNQTWEDTVYQLLLANKNNVLLEYTATCDLRDVNVERKYIDKIVYNFTLKEFREAGYTKEFSNYQSDSSKFTRTLQAIVISEFRKLMFEKNNVSINPVILLKSKTIKDSNDFYNEFFEKINTIEPSLLDSLANSSETNVFLSNAFDFFKLNGISNTKLIDLIKMDFAEEFSVNMNALSEENENIVNNLDEKGNKYRLIFTVDKLTEGWDVLSLFDIVRLYDTRQGGPKGTVSKYTISEAQLIGRGARYCPFTFEKNQIAEKRKYNDVIGTPEAICETLLYHCMRDSRYIDELKRALIATGLTPQDEPIEVEYKLKESFKQTDVYKTGFIFVNDRVEKSRDSIHSLPNSIRSKTLTHRCESMHSATSLFFENTNSSTKIAVDSDPFKLKNIDKSILYKAFRKYNQTMSFDILKEKFPNLKTVDEFLTSSNYLGDISIVFTTFDDESISRQDMLNACEKIMDEVASYITKITVSYEGTKEFRGVPIREKITNLIRKYSKDKIDSMNGEGVPQNDPYVDPSLRYDVTDKDWYVFNNNYGTSEEKSFVKYFSTKLADLRRFFDKIYLVRNEKQVKVYSFDTGEAFEPDYILLLIKEDKPKNLYLNVFVEPKGNHLLEKDAWKGKALLEFSKEAIPVVKFVDDNKYKIWGTPLYNQENTKSDFDTYFNNAFLRGDLDA